MENVMREEPIKLVQMPIEYVLVAGRWDSAGTFLGDRHDVGSEDVSGIRIDRDMILVFKMKGGLGWLHARHPISQVLGIYYKEP